MRWRWWKRGRNRPGRASRKDLEETRYESAPRPQPSRQAGSSFVGTHRASPTSSPRLTDLCGDWLTTILTLREVARPPEAARVQARIEQHRSRFETEAKNASFEPADVEAAVLVLTAFSDEVANGTIGVLWKSRLQFASYGHTQAGERVFSELLVRLRKDLRKNIQALEVACLCLLLGFEGKLAGEPLEKRTAHISGLMNDIASVRGSSPPPLAPDAVRPERWVGKVGGQVPLGMTIAGFFLALALVWLLIVVLVGNYAGSVGSLG
jgi:type IV/VI secretion system ImpK/VasF family protein